MLSLSIMGAENQDLQNTMLAVQLSADEKAWIMIPALMTLYRTHVTREWIYFKDECCGS